MLLKPKLRSHLRLDVVAPDLVVVGSESGFSVLEGRLVPLLAPYLDGEHTAAEIAGHLEGQANVLDVRFGLSLLAEDGWIVEGDDDRRQAAASPAARTAFLDSLGLDPAACRERLATTTVEVATLGALSSEPFASILGALGIRVATGGEHLVVLAESYLSPELTEINRRELAAGRPWLLVKPVGTVLWIGPLLRPPETGCWACLAQRLEENQPYRALLSASVADAADVAVPAPTLPTTLQLAWNAAATQVLRWVAAGGHPELEGRLITLDTRTLATEGHRLVRQPGCSQCGEPLAAARMPESIRLRAARRSFLVDGGYRTISPDETCRRFAHLVSPITGVVGQLRDHSGGEGAVRVYVADHFFPGQKEPQEEHRPWRTGQRRKSAGKGMSVDQARASGLCEALERYSGVYRGDEPRFRARFADLGDEAIHPNACMAFSPAQYRERERWNRLPSDYTRVPAPFDEEREVEWSPLWSLTEGCFKYLPTAYCYYGAPQGCLSEPGGDRSCFADSNGNAAGSCLEEAVLQGFLELVERDAVATWWANRLPRPCVALASFDRPYFRKLTEFYRELDREIHVLDVTHDFGIPVFAAVSWAATVEKPQILLGFGAHPDAELAIARALTEMNQFVPGLVAGRDRQVLSELVVDFTYLLPAGERQRADYPRPADGDDLREDVERLVELARERDLGTLVLDQTRPVVGLRVVKVVVPGLRHYWPRWAPGRLYDVPVAMGWLAKPRREDELNPVHLLI